MKRFLKGHGRKFKSPTGRPNYLTGSSQPFQSNPHFISEPVLSDEAREQIWKEVVVDGEAMKLISVRYGVDVRRIAAIVRLKEVEKRWVKDVSVFPGCSPIDALRGLMMIHLKFD
jgi:hypothetical protein